MLFRLTREPIKYEGKWWAWPSVAAILTIFAVALAGARVIGRVDPLEIDIKKAGEGWKVGPETSAASVHGTPAPFDQVEISFEAPGARGEDLFITFVGTPAAFTLNEVRATPGKLGRLEVPGSAVKPRDNRLVVEPGSGLLELAISSARLRTDRPRIEVLRGGASAAPNGPSQPMIAIAAAFAAVCVFALLTLAPGHALAAVGLLFLLGAAALSIANVVGAHRVFLSPGAAATIGSIPLAIVSLGTLLRERPALRVYLEVLAIYLLGVPFHVARPVAGPTPAPIPAYVGGLFEALRLDGAPPGALAIAATILASAIAAGGALAVHRAALKLDLAAPAAEVGLVLLAFGTSLFSTGTQELSGQGIAALGIGLALYGFARASEAGGLKFDALAGAALGLATAARLPAAAALALATVGLILKSRPGRLFAFLGGAAPFLALVAWYQMRTFGAPTTTAYGPLAALPSALGAPGPEAVAGLFLAPSRGLFIYSPALLLAFLGVARFARRADSASIALAFFFPPALVLLIAARGAGWAGGDSYGPRLLIEALPPLALLVAAGVDHVLPTVALRRVAWLAVAISVLLHLPHFLYPNDIWNEKYKGRLEAAAWRAPDLQIQDHVEQMLTAAGIR